MGKASPYTWSKNKQQRIAIGFKKGKIAVRFMKRPSGWNRCIGKELRGKKGGTTAFEGAVESCKKAGWTKD